MESVKPPPRGGRPRGLLQTAVHDLSRLATITNVLVRHGFSDLGAKYNVVPASDEPRADTGEPQVDARRDPADAAKRFRRMLEELGPTFVKAGQILSTRPDVLPPPFIEELRLLQDGAPSVAFPAIRAMIEESLGRPLDEAFSSFEQAPIASASMAQTHRATLPDGTPVAVKVQRPGIADTMRSDLDLLHVFARILEATIRDMEVYAPADIVRILDEALTAELDFLHEAAHLETLADAFGEQPRFRIPTLYPSHTTKTVLTMELIEGRSPSALEPGSPEAIAVVDALIEAFFQMVFEHGTFHGDPHPGNLFWDHDDRLAFIDFGLCGYLSTMQRDRLVTLIIAVLTGDVDSIARTLVRMGRPLQPIPMADFKADVASIRDRHLKRHLRSIDIAGFLEESFDAAQRYQIRIAADYSILSKAAVTIEGVVRQLAPDIDLVERAPPYQRRLLAYQYSSERLLKGALTGAVHFGGFLRDVPEQLGQVLMDAEAGRLQIRVTGEGADHIAHELNRQTTRVFMALCCAALIIATPLFYANEPLRWSGVPVLTTLCGLSAIGFAFWGLTWHVAGGRRWDTRLPLKRLLGLLRRR